VWLAVEETDFVELADADEEEDGQRMPPRMQSDEVLAVV